MQKILKSLLGGFLAILLYFMPAVDRIGSILQIFYFSPTAIHYAEAQDENLPPPKDFNETNPPDVGSPEGQSPNVGEGGNQSPSNTGDQPGGIFSSDAVNGAISFAANNSVTGLIGAALGVTGITGPDGSPAGNAAFGISIAGMIGSFAVGGPIGLAIGVVAFGIAVAIGMLSGATAPSGIEYGAVDTLGPPGDDPSDAFSDANPGRGSDPASGSQAGPQGPGPAGATGPAGPAGPTSGLTGEGGPGGTGSGGDTGFGGTNAGGAQGSGFDGGDSGGGGGDGGGGGK
ncbi:MAG: hypothetical protein HYT40_01330 [Candidatus Sungbacteria bacterium]|uniref:Uncharacterized protein n=1 Tax=Candidatus Sungiibacteriota bacterium TaxID=2750080 RepID=A0A931SDA4_9BACT|nr:hypothetical protein [Candidatus Sungbacteria bacterium]